MKKVSSERQIAALARKCGISKELATAAIENLIFGDGVLYRQVVSYKLHGAAS